MLEHDPAGRINNLLSCILDDYNPSRGLGSMTCNVYDTAWVACVSKTVLGRPQWLFPSCFAYILNAQMPKGGWQAHPNEGDADEVDGILSTMAALYCLVRHARNPYQLRYLHDAQFPAKIENAVAHISKSLKDWRISECKAVGLEILLPSLLDLLGTEGIHLEFPDKKAILDIRVQKLAKVRPEMLYESAPLALLHSLEAFHGNEDFSYDRITHQTTGGSMMASPAATASYLIRSNQWNDEAEAYLRLVLSDGDGKGSGGVPSAYPTTNFEVAWVL